MAENGTVTHPPYTMKSIEPGDPIAYRDDYDPNVPASNPDPMADLNPDYIANMDRNITIQGANQSLSQYGDDSSKQNYNNLGGMAEKNEGEGVKTSDINYNPDLKTEGLNPNFLFGGDSKVYGTQHPGYISQRNDDIASALYNEGKTSMEDVADFLYQQKGFTNSTEEERKNTITSIWKRLGDLAKQNEPERETPEMQLNQTEEGKLYGKVTADLGEPSQGIDTIPDANSIYQVINENRRSNYKALQLMSSKDIANCIYNGFFPYGEQANRDLQEYDMAKYQEVQKELKNLYAQDKINGLTHGSATEADNSYVDSLDKATESGIKTWEEQHANDDNAENVTGWLETQLRSNKVASSAKEEMLNIKKDLADLEAELENLPLKARKSFKSDIPDYIYNAYVANNQQRIQQEISKLQSRYAGLSDIYKTEVANTQREAEYNLKVDEFNNEKTNEQFNQYIKTKQLELDSIQWGKDANGNLVGYKVDPTTGEMVQVTDVTAINSYNQSVDKVTAYAQGLLGKNIGKQCLGFTNMLTKQTAGVQMLSADGSTNPTLEERIEYATNPNVSDVIPITGDIAVMKYNGTNGVNQMRGHVMYVDKVYNDENGDTWFHYLASNKSSKEGEKNVVYEGQMRVKDFYSKGGVGFWNPFKQAQYNAGANTTSTNDYYSPMQDTIDKLMEEYRNSGKTNMFSELGKFQEIYTNLYKADTNGQLSAVINQGGVGTFLDNVALAWAQSQGGDSDIQNGSALERFMGLNVEQALAAATEYVAQHKYDEKAYAGFLTLMRAVEIKLRDESGAAINKSEWATNFLLNLPKAADTNYVKNDKLGRLEEYIRRLGTDAGINSKEYIPLNLGKRQYD